MAFRQTSRATNGYGRGRKGKTVGGLGRKIAGVSSNIGVRVRGRRSR